MAVDAQVVLGHLARIKAGITRCPEEAPGNGRELCGVQAVFQAEVLEVGIIPSVDGNDGPVAIDRDAVCSRVKPAFSPSM